jgi:colanic acid/amylovoran biosynthesis glycosyltransferase
LNEANLSVLSSVVDHDGNMDGIPVYLMEAMALGKPVVSTYISGIPELVKDGAGILVPPEDSRALAEAIEEIYFMDRDRRKKMGLKGRKIVEREFNLEKEVKKIKDLFLSPLELDNGHTN